MQANKMLCVSFVLVKKKSHFNFAFALDERSLQRLSVKTTYTFYFLLLYPIVVSVCLFSVQIVTNELTIILLSVVYANESMSRNVCLRTILAKNHIFLNKARWDQIKK